MSTYKCNCENAPSVSINFGSKYNQKEVCDVIVPLGIVLPDSDTLLNWQLGEWKKAGRMSSPNPYYYPLYKDDPRLELLKFKINISYCKIDSFELSIKVDGKDIIPPVKSLSPWDIPYDKGGNDKQISLTCGDYYWEWNGYADLSTFGGIEAPEPPKYKDEFAKNVLNTKFLKRKKVMMHFKYKWGGGKEGEYVRHLKYESRAASHGDWLDSTIMPDSNYVRLHMRVVCPDKTGSNPEPGREYGTLLQLIRRGFEVHWRRDNNDIGFDITSGPLLPPDFGWGNGSVQYLHNLRLKANKRDWKLGCRAEVSTEWPSSLSERKWLDNVWLNVRYDQRSYSAGPGRNLSYSRPNHPNCDLLYMETAAHEFGHHVMYGAYNKDFSWGHKETSSWMGGLNEGVPLQQEVLKQCVDNNEKTEFDLMRYWGDAPEKWQPAFSTHVRASNDECRGAIWLSKVGFKLSRP